MSRGDLRNRAIVLAVVVLGWGRLSASDGSDLGERSPLPGFELVQYSASASLSPEYVMGLDRNGEILLACRQPTTTSDLRQSGFEVSESQLELLRVMGLLQRLDDGRWVTTFPILEREEVDDLRRATGGLARRAVLELATEIAALRAALEAENLEAHAYAVYFSYVLDGMVWGFFEEYRRVPVRRISASRPFWAGELWALDARRESLSTSAIGDRGMTFKLLSSTSVRHRLQPLIAARATIVTALREYVETGRVTDAAATPLLQRFGIVDQQGVFTVPVIDEMERKGVSLAAEQLTSALVDWLEAELDLQLLQQRFGFRSEPQALVIAYHELMWQVIDELVREAIVERPAALGSLEDERRAAELVVIVDRAKRPVVDQDTEPEEAPALDASDEDQERGKP